MQKTEKLPNKLIYFQYLEAILVIGFVAIGAFSFLQYRNAPMKTDYIPNAITGLTTLSGILTAFSGLWLSRQETPADKKTKKWMQERSVAIIFVLVFGLLLVAGSLTSLVYQSAEFAFNIAVFGTLMIVWVAADVLFFQVTSTMSLDKSKHAQPSNDD